MKNLPAARQFTVPAFTMEERSPMLKANLRSYTNLIIYSVFVLLAGVVVGLEQGRPPLLIEATQKVEKTLAEQKIAEVKKVIQLNFTPPETFQDFRLVDVGNSVEIHFGTANLFGRGQAVISKETEKKMEQMAAALLPVAKDSHIQIEAFTDDAPMQAGSWQYPTNWELSGARAARVLRVFNKAGFANLTFVGYGEQHPLFPNRDEKGNPIETNRLRNRRVVIRLSSL